MNFFLIVLLLIAFSVKVEKVLKFGSPPPPQINPSTSYSENTNQIFVFGGEILGNAGYSSSLYLFNLSSSIWEELIPSSSITPEGLTLSRSFIQNQNKLIVFFGKTIIDISSKVYSFNLATLIWSPETFTGDSITSSIRGGQCLFEYNSTRYCGIYGGITSNGISEDLYLINIETLEVIHLENKGEGPGKQAYGSLCYYDESLYFLGFNDVNNSTLFYKYNLVQETWSIVESDNENILGRTGHASFIYEDKLYIYFGHSFNKIQNYWQAFNLNTSQWEVSQDILEPIKEFSYLSINSTLYIVCGSNEDGYQNSIISYKAGSSNKKVDVQSASVPNKRGYHASFEYGNNIYIFGGSSEGKYFNDMWKFEILKTEWTEVKMEGVIPEPRDRMIVEEIKGLGILILGGRSENTIYDDYYYFSTEHLKWTLLPDSNSDKKSKFNGCLIFYNLGGFYVGGQDFSRAYSDVLRYDYFTNKSFKIPTDNGLPIELKEHRCWLHSTESNYYLYVFGGTDYYKTPNDKTYKFEFFDIKYNNLSYTLNKTIEVPQINLASSTSIISGNYVFIIGGLIWGEKVNEYLYVFDLNSDTLQKESHLGNLNLIGHSTVQVGNSIYIFGGLLTKDGYIRNLKGTNGLLKLNFESTDKFQLTCSGGNIESGSCKPCLMGTYYSNEKCEKCPIGTYSNIIGAQELSGCIPCKAGYFNDKEGASFCKVCPANKNCPAGSALYMDSKETMIASEGNTNEYTENTELIENIVKISSLSLLGLFFLCLVWIIWFEDCKKFYVKFDVFVSSHRQELNVPVYFRKTPLGGLFSIIFVLLAISTFCTSLLSFFTDNITQSQTLIPSIAYNDNIKASYVEFYIKFYIFGGICEVDDKCNSYITVNSTGFKYSEMKITCINEENNCIIKPMYKNLEIEKKSTLSIIISQVQSYCSIISLNVTVSSSIPNEFSKLFIPLYSPTYDKVFKGNGPNKFKIEFIPSVRYIKVFYSESTKWPRKETGFHLQNLFDHEVGSTVDNLLFNTAAGLVVEVKIQTSNSVLVTKRNLKYSTSLFLGTLLGSIFGLSGTIGLILNFAESAEYALIKRKLSKEKIKNLTQQREFISKNFYYERNKFSRKSSYTLDN